jgi:hypothetical protein
MLAADKLSSLLRTLVNYNREMFNTVSSGLYYKTFRIVIDDRNDSTIIEPVL